jgi:hypothetical protein
VNTLLQQYPKSAVIKSISQLVELIGQSDDPNNANYQTIASDFFYGDDSPANWLGYLGIHQCNEWVNCDCGGAYERTKKSYWDKHWDISWPEMASCQVLLKAGKGNVVCKDEQEQTIALTMPYDQQIALPVPTPQPTPGDDEGIESLPVGSMLDFQVNETVAAADHEAEAVDGCRFVLSEGTQDRELVGEITITTTELPSLIKIASPTPWGMTDLPGHEIQGVVKLNGSPTSMRMYCDDYYVGTVGALRKALKNAGGFLNTVDAAPVSQ